jgi:cytochrome c oxidase subunit 1
MSSANMLLAPTESLRRIQRGWLFLALTNLGIAGLFSLPPVFLRGSFFASLFPIEHVFATALVVHVVLSVVLWFLSFCAMFLMASASQHWKNFYKTALWLAIFATICIATAPFFGFPEAIKNNYVPVLNNLPFFLGLGFFSASMLLMAGLTLLSPYALMPGSTHQANLTLSICIIIAAVCFSVAGRLSDNSRLIGDMHFFEHLFWGGGHILQFVYVALLALSWWHLFSLAYPEIKKSEYLFSASFWINAALTLPAPLFYRLAGGLEESHYWFTLHMRIFGGIAPIIVFALLTFAYLKTGEKICRDKRARTALILSLLLFLLGGILSFLIDGQNAIIPAHYHGSIVSITLALMATSYVLLPRFGCREVSQRAGILQLCCYGIGQFMHVSGLGMMGGYGALRKDPGSSATIDTMFGKILFFSGGVLALAGGLWFLLLVIQHRAKKSG